MNSEKVKEIKKALEFCVSLKKGCRDCPYSEIGCYRLLKDILILINELECENERLNVCYKVKAYDKLRAENKQLKDQIAELKKENAKLLDSVETVQNNRCTTKCELTKRELKHFAERLKEKLKEKVNADNVDGFVECSKLISETLKDFMGEK